MITVTTVHDGIAKTHPRGYLGEEAKPIRTPCVSCPHGYNTLKANITSDLIIPDSNALYIVNSEGSFRSRLSLSNCDPYMLRSSVDDHSFLYVLCKPTGREARLYLVDMSKWSTDDPWVFQYGSSLLPDVGLIFERNGMIQAILATAGGLVFGSIEDFQLNHLPVGKTCSQVLRLTDFSNILANKYVIECGNSTAGIVDNTYLCDTSIEGCQDVFFPPNRKLGKLVTSKDASILVNVGRNRIDIQKWNHESLSQVLHSITMTDKEFFDAFIETMGGSYILIYSEKSGSAYYYNITSDINGDDNVIRGKFQGEYTTCSDCSGLLQLKDGYFATGTSEGVAWFSVTPPELLNTGSGFEASHLAYYSASSLTPPLPGDLVDPPVNGPMIGGIGGAVVGFLVVAGLVVIVSPVIVYYYRRRSKRKRHEGTASFNSRQGNVVLNNQPNTVVTGVPPTDMNDPPLVTQPSDHLYTDLQSPTPCSSSPEGSCSKLVVGMGKDSHQKASTLNTPEIAHLLKQCDACEHHVSDL